MNKIHVYLTTALTALAAAVSEIHAQSAAPAADPVNPTPEPEPMKERKPRGLNKEKPAETPAPVEQPKETPATPPAGKTVADNAEAWAQAKLHAKPLVEGKKQLLLRELVTKHGGDKFVSTIPLENLEAFKAEVTDEIEKAGLGGKEEY